MSEKRMSAQHTPGPRVQPNVDVPLAERVRIALAYAERGDASGAADHLRHAVAEEAARAAIANAGKTPPIAQCRPR